MKTHLRTLSIAALCTVFLAGAARAYPHATYTIDSPSVNVPGENVVCTEDKGAAEQTVEQLESLNNQIKPVRDIIGYVKSPQSLAIKLVNDHIVTIPGWIGFLLDPIGTIRSKAMDEARNQARSTLKAALIPENRCAPEVPATLVGPSGPPDDITPHFPRGNPFTQT